MGSIFINDDGEFITASVKRVGRIKFFINAAAGARHQQRPRVLLINFVGLRSRAGSNHRRSRHHRFQVRSVPTFKKIVAFTSRSCCSIQHELVFQAEEAVQESMDKSQERKEKKTDRWSNAGQRRVGIGPRDQVSEQGKKEVRASWSKGSKKKNKKRAISG